MDDRLIAEFEPVTLVFLGDLLHARESLSTLTLDAWRVRHASMRVVLVEGSHDRHAGALAPTVDVEAVRELWLIGAWALAVRSSARGRVRLCARGACASGLPDRDADRFGARTVLSLWKQSRVLPVFGSFTGGERETGRVLGERVFLVVQEKVIELQR